MQLQVIRSTPPPPHFFSPLSLTPVTQATLLRVDNIFESSVLPWRIQPISFSLSILNENCLNFNTISTGLCFCFCYCHCCCCCCCCWGCFLSGKSGFRPHPTFPPLLRKYQSYGIETYRIESTSKGVPFKVHKGSDEAMWNGYYVVVVKWWQSWTRHLWFLNFPKTFRIESTESERKVNKTNKEMLVFAENIKVRVRKVIFLHFGCFCCHSL